MRIVCFQKWQINRMMLTAQDGLCPRDRTTKVFPMGHERMALQMRVHRRPAQPVVMRRRMTGLSRCALATKGALPRWKIMRFPLCRRHGADVYDIVASWCATRLARQAEIAQCVYGPGNLLTRSFLAFARNTSGAQISHVSWMARGGNSTSVVFVRIRVLGYLC